MKLESEAELSRVLGPFSAMAIVIGAIIGIGIFFTPQNVAQTAGSQSLAMTAWAIGGTIAILGALTFAELGGVYSRTAGQYEILRDAFGPVVGFVYVFCNATAVQAGAIAIVAYLSAQNLCVALQVDTDLWRLPIATAMIVGLTVMNILGVKWGSLAQNVTVIAKLLTILLIVLLAIGFGKAPAQVVSTAPAASPGSLGLLFAAAVPTLFSFGGWQQALWVGGEIKNPVRNIPFAILGGVIVVIVAYLSVNWAYFRLLGYASVAESQALAADAVATVWAANGRRFIAAAVAFSAFGVLNAMLLTGSRLICGLSRDGRFFSLFGWVHPRFDTPLTAIGLLGCLGLGMLLIVGFNRADQLMNGVVLVDTCGFLATGLALIVLRTSRGDIVWPFRTPLFPLIPLLFCVGEMALIYGAFQVEKYRLSAYIGAIWIAAAVVCYFAFFYRRREPSSSRENRLS
jgi:APA family basic amino acid/polyamine antiporter